MSSDQWFDVGYPDYLDGFRLIAVDRLGHGESSRPADPAEYDERDIVADICAVLDALSITRTAVWGFSLGGKSAATFAAIHPGRVQALACGSMPDPSAPMKSRSRLLEIAELCSSPGGLRTFLEAAGVSDERDLAAGETRNPVPAAVAACLVGSAEFWPDHHLITSPTLWYIGAGEGGFLPGEQQLGEELHVEMHVTPSANHAAAFTDAATACHVVVPMLRRVCSDDAT